MYNKIYKGANIMERNNRKTSEEILKEAQGYFDKLGLTANVDAYFESQIVKELVHERYDKYQDGIKALIEHMPSVMKKRSDEVIGEAIGKEDAFVHDVKANLICNIAMLIMHLEHFMPVDETISHIWGKAFTDEADGKMLEMVKYFADGLADSLTADFLAAVSMPSDLPPEVAALLSIIGGEGAIALNLDEFEQYMNEEDDED